MPWTYAGSRLALILRRLRGRFGIAAPRVSVRTQVPWYLRALVVASTALFLFALAGWTYDAGRRVAGFDQGETSQTLDRLHSRNVALEEDVVRLRNNLMASESSLQIERAAQKLLAEKHGILVQENNKLREELAIFERLAKLEGKRDDEVALDQVNVRAEGARGAYRYSFLIALQGGRRGKDAKFSLQIGVTLRGQGAGAKITFPHPEETDLSQYDIPMRNFRRIEGKFNLPAGSDVSTVEIRILEAGTVKASKSVNL